MTRLRILTLLVALLAGGALAALALGDSPGVGAAARLIMTHASHDGGPSGVVPAVSGVGDVNGDGHPDFAVGMADLYGGNETLQSAGKIFVITSPPSTQKLDLGALGSSGFTINSTVAFSYAGTSVAPAGDVNGDGYADILIGGSRAGAGRNGAVYVIFGSASPADIDLSNLGTHGYEIDGPAGNSQFGSSVASLGDLNGDGIPDFVIGAPAATGAQTSEGAAFVVWGKSTTTTEAVGSTTGYEIDGNAFGEDLGTSVAGVPDVNGDGKPEILVGAPAGFEAAGTTYLLHGKSTSGAQDAAASAALTLNGTGASNEGTHVADLGAIGGHEMIGSIGPIETYAGRQFSGTVAVLRADTTGTLTSTTLGANGYLIANSAAVTQPQAIAPAGGDLTGDGVPDLLIGAPSTNANQGAMYLVPGEAGPAYADVDLAAPPAGERSYVGDSDYDEIGGSVAGAGDVDGDGKPDLLTTVQNRFEAFLFTGSAGTTTATTTTTSTPTTTTTSAPPGTSVTAPAPAPTTTTQSTPKPPAPVTVPKVDAAKVILLPSAAACVSRRDFKIHLKVPKGVKITRASVVLNKAKAKIFTGKRLTSVIDLRGLPKGTFTVKITLTRSGGPSLRSSRKYHTCVAGKKR